MVASAPDLIVDSQRWDPVGYLGYNKLFSTEIEKSGKHRNYGILAANFALSKNNNSLADILPTVLDLLQVETPQEVDGSSLLSD